jgi:ABC-type transporter Mla MlaB component
MKRNNLQTAHDLPFVVPTFVIPMLKITRVTDTGTTTLTVSGRIQAEHLPDLRRSVEVERTRDVVLDLSEVSLVDGEVVRFLLHCEIQGIQLAHCPAYVREWMVREKRAP